MRVLFLAHSFPRFASDPVGSFVLRLAVALLDRGVEVRVLAPSAPGLPRSDLFEGIPVERFRYAPSRLETLAYTGTMRTQVKEQWSARLALGGLVAADFVAALAAQRRFRAHIVHAHWWFPAGVIGSWLRVLGGAPFVTTMHGSDLRLALNVPSARRLFRHVMRRSAAVTTVSSWLATETTGLVPDIRPVVAPMPVAPTLFSPGGPRDANRLLFVGKLNPQKGIHHLLNAMALMQTTATLDIVVGVGSHEDETRRLASQLGIADRLRWHPLLEQAQLADMYRRATALVVPAIDEGLGLTAIEAMLCETPVIAFASGGLLDIVLPDATGLLAPPGDAAALARQLDRLLREPDQGREMGRRGREHVLATFAPEAAARRYEDIYRGVRADRLA